MRFVVVILLLREEFKLLALRLAGDDGGAGELVLARDALVGVHGGSTLGNHLAQILAHSHAVGAEDSDDGFH